MRNTNSKRKPPDWFTAEFYSQAYARFNRIRWGKDPFKGKYSFHNLDPDEFRLSDDEMSRIPLYPFTAANVELSIQSLVGQINRFNSDLFALKAWRTILPDYQRSQRIHLISEFVEPLLHSCMFAPFALRNQITFTGTYIAVLLEKGRREPKLPSAEANSRQFREHFRRWAGSWHGFELVEKSLNQLSDEKFNQRTNEFRHRYTHRIPPRIAYGLWPNFRFERTGKQLTVYFSPEKPLRLSQSIKASVVQHRACIKAFQAFWKMLTKRLQA